jgi:hypothetical protein
LTLGSSSFGIIKNDLPDNFPYKEKNPDIFFFTIFGRVLASIILKQDHFIYGNYAELISLNEHKK